MTVSAERSSSSHDTGWVSHRYQGWKANLRIQHFNITGSRPWWTPRRAVHARLRWTVSSAVHDLVAFSGRWIRRRAVQSGPGSFVRATGQTRSSNQDGLSQ